MFAKLILISFCGCFVPLGGGGVDTTLHFFGAGGVVAGCDLHLLQEMATDADGDADAGGHRMAGDVHTICMQILDSVGAMRGSKCSKLSSSSTSTNEKPIFLLKVCVSSMSGINSSDVVLS